MTNSFSKILFAILLCSLHLSAQTITKDNREIFTQKQISNSGIVSLNDIFNLSAKWNITSINGYSHKSSANLLSLFQDQNYIVVVNGQKIGLSFLDEQNLNLLPFTADQIDTLIFINTPGIYKGYYVEAGLIEFILKKPSSGFSINLDQSLGNEIGDPGPYAYTELRTPNVDKLGFLTGLTIQSKGISWGLTVNFKYNENYVTDQQLKNRIAFLSDNSKAVLIGAGVGLDYKLLGGVQNFTFAFNENNDFFYYSPFGNEIPSKRFFRHIGFSGYVPLSDYFRLNYKIIKNINELAKVDNSLNLNFNLKLNSTIISVGTDYNYKDLSSSLGVDYEKYDANRSGLKNDDQIEFLKLFWNISFKPLESIRQNAGLSLVKNWDNSVTKAYLSFLWHFSNFNTFHINLSASQRMQNEELDHITWTRNNEALLTPDLIDEIILNDNVQRKSFTIDFAYSYIPKTNNSFSASVFLRKFEDLYIENYTFSFNPDNKLIENINDVKLSQQASVLGGSVQAEYQFSGIFKNRLSYVYHSGYNTTEFARNELQKFPNHHLIYFLDIAPVENFTISLKALFTSKSEWSDYRFVTYQSNSFYNHLLSERLIFDVGLNKWFWENKLWINVIFKNIFNQKEIYHPLGVNLGLRFYLIVQLHLQSLFN